MLKLLSYLYKFIINKRNSLFDNNSFKTIKCKNVVISIGNISVGGTGKTPFLISMGHILKENNIKFAVVGKGYKRKSKREIIVCDGKKILSNAKTAGDEMILIAKSLNSPVITNDKKYLAAQKADNLFDIECILVDDGFQHRKLYRDLDIVIIDKDTLQEDYLIPAGRLRESFSSLLRADLIVLKDLENHSLQNISEFIQNKTIIYAKTEAETPYNLISKQKIDNLPNDEFIVISGIAKPQKFIALLKTFKINIKKTINFDDHHYYTKRDISSIINLCNQLSIKNIAVTEKDAVKLSVFGNHFANNNIKCYVFPISINIEKGSDMLINIIKNIL